MNYIDSLVWNFQLPTTTPNPLPLTRPQFLLKSHKAYHWTMTNQLTMVKGVEYRRAVDLTKKERWMEFCHYHHGIWETYISWVLISSTVKWDKLSICKAASSPKEPIIHMYRFLRSLEKKCLISERGRMNCSTSSMNKRV